MTGARSLPRPGDHPMIGHICGNCGGSVDQADTHLAECLETIGELYCSECWDEMCAANAAYELEDAE